MGNSAKAIRESDTNTRMLGADHSSIREIIRGWHTPVPIYRWSINAAGSPDRFLRNRSGITSYQAEGDSVQRCSRSAAKHVNVAQYNVVGVDVSVGISVGGGEVAGVPVGVGVAASVAVAVGVGVAGFSCTPKFTACRWFNDSERHTLVGLVEAYQLGISASRQ